MGSNSCETSSPGLTVRFTVNEIDEETGSVVIELNANNIDFESVVARIHGMGATVHTIDEVEVVKTNIAGAVA